MRAPGKRTHGDLRELPPGRAALPRRLGRAAARPYRCSGGRSMKIAFFASSLVSAYWNGAATYYRGMVYALHDRGHEVTFYEPDAFGRQEHRDIPDPDWARVVVYSAKSEAELLTTVEQARVADLIIKASGVGV